MKYAPRLAKNTIRVTFGSRMAPKVKEALRTIAKHENKSMSWVVEQVVIDYFSMPELAFKHKIVESTPKKKKPKP